MAKLKPIMFTSCKANEEQGEGLTLHGRARARADRLDRRGVRSPYLSVICVLVFCAALVMAVVCWVVRKEPDKMEAAAYFAAAFAVVVLAFFYIQLALTLWRYNLRLVHHLHAMADALELTADLPPEVLVKVLPVIAPSGIELDPIPADPTERFAEALASRLKK